MTTNPKNIYEAYTLMLSELLGNAPHHIRYDASEEDWDERIQHLLKIANALDAYLLEVGKDCSQNAHTNIDMSCFRDIVSNAFDDALGQMQHGAVAARERETSAAE